MARDATGGVGGAEERERLMGNPKAGRRPLSVVLSIPGWLYLVGCVIGFFPMLYNMIASAIAGHWAEAAGGMAVWVFWPALFFIHGPWSELPRAFILTFVLAVAVTGWATFIVEWRRWRRRRRDKWATQ